MTVAFDAASNGTGTHTHTPVGTPRGVLIIIRMLNAGDNVTGVTYGGVSMGEVAGSPLLASGAEGGSLHAFFLGSSIPTGAQSVVASVTTGTPRVTCYTVTASADTEVVDTTTINETGVTGDRTGTLSLGGRTSFVAEGGWCSADAVTSITELAGWTLRNERDDGAEVNFGYSYDTIGSSDVTFGATVTGTEDFACLGVAISEVAAGGAYNLDAASAAYAYTATAAALEFDRLLNADGASYTYTASDAALEFDRQIAADSAAYSWTANDASLEYTPVGSTYTLNADSAAYVWSATDATLTYVQNYSLDADPSAFIWTATAAGLEYSGEEAQRPTGGWVFPPHYGRRQTDEERRKERERLGIIPKEQRKLDRAAKSIAQRISVRSADEVSQEIMRAKELDKLLGDITKRNQEIMEGFSLLLVEALLARILEELRDEDDAIAMLLLEM